MSSRITNNLAKSLARILVMGGIERKELASALDKEAKLCGGVAESILERLISDIDSLNFDAMSKELTQDNLK